MKSYDDYRKQKESVKYDTVYESSSCKKVVSNLGTIESDASCLFGKQEKEIFRGKKIFDILVKTASNFSSVLDVGAGGLEATKEFLSLGKTVDICDFDDGYYLSKTKLDLNKLNNFYVGDVNTITIPNQYDVVWCAHVLEHQLNINTFLKKLHSLVKEGGYLAIVVPPRKPFVVGGHVNMWNGGLLLYNLILAGFDCSDAKLLQYDYNIGVVVKKKTIDVLSKITFDLGDLELLKEYFPIEICEGFNGDLMEVNIK